MIQFLGYPESYRKMRNVSSIHNDSRENLKNLDMRRGQYAVFVLIITLLASVPTWGQQLSKIDLNPSFRYEKQISYAEDIKKTPPNSDTIFAQEQDITQSILSTDSMRTYQRKSISYIDTLCLATPNARKISPEQASELVNIIKQQIEMKRFDYNPLPKDLVQKFTQELEKNTLTLDQLTEHLNANIVPIIIKVLNERMEIRAKGLISETERNKYIILKAKESGLAAEHFEKILNSAYLYVPVLTDYSRLVSEIKVKEEGKIVTKNMIEYKLEGGIIWFSIKTSDGESKVEVIKSIKGESWCADIDDSTAFSGAALLLADYFKIRTAEIPDFTVTGQVIEHSSRKIGFNLGEKDGIFIDMRFRVYEETEDEYGNYKLNKKGFFLVRRVGDNRVDRNALSYGKPIIGTPDYGMLIQEFPRLSTDISCSVYRYGIKLSPGKTDFNPALSVDGKTNFMFPVFNIAIQKNIARTTRITQFFVTLGGNIGLPPTNNINILFETLPYPMQPDYGLCWNLYGGITKKIYFRRFALVLEPRYEYQSLIFWKEWKVENTRTSIYYRNSTFLFSPFAGIELALKADLNLGIMMGLKGLCYRPPSTKEKSFYSFFKSFKLLSAQNLWSVKRSSIEDTKEKQVDRDFLLLGPQVEYASPFFGVRLNYSPGSLENIVKVVTQKKPHERVYHISLFNSYTISPRIGVESKTLKIIKGPHGRFLAGTIWGLCSAMIPLIFSILGGVPLSESAILNAEAIGSSLGVYGAGRLLDVKSPYWATLTGSVLGLFAERARVRANRAKGLDSDSLFSLYIPIGAEIGFELGRLIPKLFQIINRTPEIDERIPEIYDNIGEVDKLAAIENAKKEWDLKLYAMKIAYNEVKVFEKTNNTKNMKVKALQKFLDTYRKDNPYSNEDDIIRQEAVIQLQYWKKQPSDIPRRLSQKINSLFTSIIYSLFSSVKVTSAAN